MQQKKEIHEKLKEIAEDYLTKVQDVNKRLIDGEKALRDEYQKTYDDRVKQIADYTSLFSEVKLTEMVKFDKEGNIEKQIDLLDNLRGQVTNLRNWMDDLTTLEIRGIDSNLLKELQAMGAGAAAEIDYLTKMSAQQLDEYQMLWKTKTELANIQATKELTDLKNKTEIQIKELHDKTKVELDALGETFEKEMREIRKGTEDEFDLLNASLPDIGKNAMQGLLNGLQSMKGALVNEANSIANTLKNTMQKALDIHSPSRWFESMIGENSMLGIIKGFKGMLPQLEETALEAAGALKLADVNSDVNQTSSVSLGKIKMPDPLPEEKQKIEVHLNNQFDGEEFATWLDKRSSGAYDIQLYKKGF